MGAIAPYAVYGRTSGLLSGQEPQAEASEQQPEAQEVMDTIPPPETDGVPEEGYDIILPDSIPYNVEINDSIATGVPDMKSGAALPAIKVTPVDYDREKPVQPGLHYYDKHGEPLKTPVRFLAELDTVAKVMSKPVFPGFNGVSIGVNFFDGIMMIAGQQRASFDVWADCSILNWIFPIVEAGIGISNASPDDGRFHFRVKPSPYVKAGFNYNFLYKSKPDYQVYLGLRACWSSFNYDITQIQPGSDYYFEDGPRDLYGLHSTAWYGEALAGLKVKIWKFISMGWSVRLNFGFKQKYSDPDYPAWFTPGKGTSSALSASFSLIFNVGQKRSEPEEMLK